MGERCAIVGIGQSDHKRIRDDLSMPGLLREAGTRALEDAGMDWSDIEAVVFGKAPDQFEGIMQPELFLADALGAAVPPTPQCSLGIEVHEDDTLSRGRSDDPDFAGECGGSNAALLLGDHHCAHNPSPMTASVLSLPDDSALVL